MYKKIIVSLALNHGIAGNLIETARKLRDEDGEILAVHVYEPPNSSVSTYLTDEDVANALKTTKEALAARIGKATDVKSVILKGHSGRDIADYARKIGADCIVVGSHKPGLSDYFLGSTAARVVRRAPCSVHVSR